MNTGQNEKIMINDRILQYGVLTKDNQYQCYTFPGMTVEEIAFCVMVTIRLLEQQPDCIKSKDEFIKLVNKYYDDPQYAPIEVTNEQN